MWGSREMSWSDGLFRSCFVIILTCEWLEYLIKLISAWFLVYSLRYIGPAKRFLRKFVSYLELHLILTLSFSPSLLSLSFSLFPFLPGARSLSFFFLQFPSSPSPPFPYLHPLFPTLLLNMRKEASSSAALQIPAIFLPPWREPALNAADVEGDRAEWQKNLDVVPETLPRLTLNPRLHRDFYFLKMINVLMV